MLTTQDIAAFEKVKNTVDTMRAEYETVCQDITATQNLLNELPLLPVPVDDLKAAILDFVDARGKAYLEATVKPGITAFATHHMSGLAVPAGKLGMPLGFYELQGAIAGQDGSISQAQFVTVSGKSQFNDFALYAFFGPLVMAGLSAVMETMTGADLGYSNLKPEQIGTDRATRRAAIQAAQDQLNALLARKADIAKNLSRLGVIVKG